MLGFNQFFALKN